MPRKSIIYLALALAVLFAWKSDNNYPQNYFASPVARTMQLSGTFGELRSNHFHAGIDIKSINGRPGEKILASAHGYIARISVRPGGYGNALYIAHPNGYTTVYAHLDRFTDTIAQYVKAKQYEMKRFNVELYPRPDQFRLEQNEHIGYLGNSGSSFGPHLHFEIRRTANQIPINPLHFGIEVSDNTPPNIRALAVYQLDDKLNTLEEKYYDLVRVATGKYVIRDTIVAPAWRLSFGLKTDDRVSGSTNRNGIYALKMLVDSTENIGFAMDEIAFNKSLYINCHIDYKAKANKRGSYHRCYKVAGNKLNIYNERHGNGVVPIYAGSARKVTLSAFDHRGNESQLTFYVKRDSSMQAHEREPCQYLASPQSSLRIESTGFKYTIASNSVYSNQCIDFEASTYRGRDLFAVGGKTIPQHRSADIQIQLRDTGPVAADKYFIAKVEDGEIVNYGGTLANGWLTTRTRSFGEFTTAYDTIAPKIRPMQNSSAIKGASRMRFKITDNMPTGGSASGLKYEARVDGKWLLMEYDAKNDMLVHWFDDRIAAGKHQLELTVTDDRGNREIYTAEFER